MTQRLPITFPLAFAWTLSVAMALQLLVTLSMKLRPSAGHDIVHLGAVSALVFVLGIAGILGLHGSDAPLRSSLGIRPTHPVFLVLGVMLGFSLHLPAEHIETLVQRFYQTPPEEYAARIALLTAPTPLRLVLLLLVVACVGPLVEELFFRGALYGALRRSHSLVAAAVVTSFCFVVGHLDFYLWAPLTVVSGVLSLLRAVSGSLLPSLAAHVAFNAVTVLGLVTTTPNGAAAEAPRLGVAPALAGWGVTFVLVGLVQYAGSRTAGARRGRAQDVE